MLTTKDLYWVAGILEGEGYFGYRSTPRITLGMTDRDIIEKARAILNPKAFIGIKKGKAVWCKDASYIYITGKNAASWMMTLYSLMGERRKAKIKDSLAQWKLANFQCGEKDTCKRGHKLNRIGSNGGRYCNLCHNRSVRNNKLAKKRLIQKELVS